MTEERSGTEPSSAAASKKKKHVVTKANYEALAEFRYALRKFLAFSEEAASTVGLTPQQHQALLAIKGNGGADWLSVSQIADRLFIRHHTAVELVDRLTAVGMVARKPDPSDGRRIRVAVTKDGEAVLRELSAIHIEELKNIRPTLRKLLKQFDAKRPTT